jgi:hypothetical protein
MATYLFDICYRILRLIPPTWTDIAAQPAASKRRTSCSNRWYLRPSDWHRIVMTYLDASERPENDGDERRDALNAKLAQDTEAILARPVRTWADLIRSADSTVFPRLS